MNSELLHFIENLYNHDKFKGLYYSLTLNYKRVVSDYKPEVFNFDSIFKIKDLMSEYDVETFNFTLYDKYPKERYDNDYNFEYRGYWYSLNYIFHGKNSINCQLNFNANHLSINQLPENLKLNEDSVLRLIEIGEYYKEASHKLYDLLKP